MKVAHIVYGGSIELVGYDLRPVAADKPSYTITYYWKCLAAIPENYAVFVHISRSGEEAVIGDQDHYPMGGAYPTSRWRPGEFFADEALLGLAEGTYDLRVGLYLLESFSRTDPTISRLTITQADPGIPIDERETRALVGSVKVDRRLRSAK
jgi:hypothetical protein